MMPFNDSVVCRGYNNFVVLNDFIDFGNKYADYQDHFLNNHPVMDYVCSYL